MSSTFPLIHTKAPVAIFLGVGCGVFWLGERMGLIALPYTRPVLDLYGDDEDRPTASNHPITPRSLPPRRRRDE